MRLTFSAAACLIATLIPSGCSRTRTTAPSAIKAEEGVVLRGVARGGQQPISGMRIYLLAASTTGYGTASVSLLNGAATGDSDSLGAYVLSEQNGNFSITGDYSCTPGSQVYLYGRGGNAGAGVNTSAGLMAALGNCPAAGNLLAATPYIVLNEVSTVAAAYAMAGFAADATHVASSGTALARIGIKNAFLNASNLETLSTGEALATTPASNGKAPQSEINTLADILAACVNSDGTITGPTNPTACYTLFNSALSDGASGTVPSETVTAAINIAHHPITNVAALYGLQVATAPFQPTLVAAPNDWTLAVSYTTVQLDSAGKGATQGLLAIDAEGDVWIVNLQTTSTNLTPSVSELSSNGAILSGPVGFTGGGIGGSSNTPGGIAIDLAGDVWISSGYYRDQTSPPSYVGLALSRLSSSGIPISGPSGYTSGCGGQGLAIDGFGNVWTSAGKCDSSGSYLFVVPSPTLVNPGYPNQGSSISIDTSENAWYSGTTTINFLHFPPQIQGGVWKVSNTGTMLFYTQPYSPISGGFGGASYIANDNTGNAWFLGGLASIPLGIYELDSAGDTIFSASPATATFYLKAPIAVDGAGTIWAGNDDFNLFPSIPGLIELSNDGIPLSGTTGFVFPITGYTVSGVGVDGSGNVWVSLASDNVASGPGFGEVLQFVGAATPVVTPLSVGARDGTLATRP